jgi:hypothetical protein
MGQHSAKELHCMDDHQVSIGSELLSVFLAKIFSRFGDEPTGWIYAGIAVSLSVPVGSP